jgi:integrase
VSELSLVGATDHHPAGRGLVRHATREQYRQWLVDVLGSSRDLVRQRLARYDRFVARWPRLVAWFAAPVRERLDLDVLAEHGHRCPQRLRPTHAATQYLCYLGFVHRVRFDTPFLLSIKATCIGHQSLLDAFGLDGAVLDSYTDRLVRLGYSPAHARPSIIWAYSRLMLRRGDPDARRIDDDDLLAFAEEIRRFHDTPEGKLVAVLRRRVAGDTRTVEQIAAARRHHHLSRLFILQVLLFNIGQTSVPPRRGTRPARSWRDQMTPPGTPEPIKAVVERWLLLRDAADQTSENQLPHLHAALRSFLTWLLASHPEVTNLAMLTRRHMEDYLRHLPTLRRQRDGAALATTTRRVAISNLRAFFAETLSWGWDDVPRRLLLTAADQPRTPKALPRFVPREQLDRLMAAAEQLPDRQQRAALLLLRWSGARRDEIRRLDLDCLDHYPDGHPRLRIPVGKGLEERLVPLHPHAAQALAELIAETRARGTGPRHDRRVGRQVTYVFSYRGQLRSPSFLFHHSLRQACEQAGLVDQTGKALISPHRFRHTVGTQLAEGGAKLQTIMSILGHKSPAMSMVYSHISDGAIKGEYERVLSAGGRIAGPAAEAILTHDGLTSSDIDWLKTNYFKTELELGHCLRLPQEGPCECDLYLRCSKFFTTTAHAPRLRARSKLEQQLIDDAAARGWDREVQRHTAILNRIHELLDQLGEPHELPDEELSCADRPLQAE